MKRKYILWVAALMASLLIVLTGCQPVSGVDLNKALENNFNVKSYEGAQEMSLEITGGESGKNKALDLLRTMTFSLTDIKVQDATTMTAGGKLKLKTADIPFTMFMNDKEIAFQVEGAAKPLVLNLEELQKSNPQAGGVEQMAVQQELIRAVAPLIIKHLPNPQVVQVTQVNESVHGETLALNKVHVEIKGSEVAALLQTALDSLLKDDAGFTELVKIVLSQQTGMDGSKVDPAMLSLMTQAAKAELSKAASQLTQELSKDEAKEVLNDRNYMKMDLYADNSYTIHKSAFELVINNPNQQASASEVQSIKLTGTSEMWNVNKPVTVPALDRSKGVLEINEEFQTAHFIKNLDKQSAAYKLLVNDLQVLKKHFSVPIGEYVEEPDSDFFPEAYIDPASEKAMVPARFVVERLDAGVKWDQAKQQVTIVDILSGKTIVLTIGSTTALVDGKPVQMETDAKLNAGNTFVPVRFLAETLGFQVDWNNDEWSVIIVRD